MNKEDYEKLMHENITKTFLMSPWVLITELKFEN